jgi:hypothetical protein
MPQPGKCPSVDVAFRAVGEAGNEIVFNAQGTSMFPAICQGDRVSIRPLPAQCIGWGDVFAFWENGSVVVHRCLGKKIKGETLWLCQKGDNLAGWGWVHEAHVIGKVTGILKPGSVVDLSAVRWADRSEGMMASFCWMGVSIAEMGERWTGGIAGRIAAHVLSTLGRGVVRAVQFLRRPGLRRFN